jgi:hypothetical protein
MTRIDIQIDELVLSGFNQKDRVQIGEALERELAALITERRLSNESATRLAADSKDVPSFNLPADMNPKKIGVETARSVYRRLTNGAR